MKIQLKRSNVIDGASAKQPTAGQMEYGELAVNYNASDPTIFIKDSNNQIIRLAGAGYDYDDLDNLPTIGDGTITINDADGAEVGSFTVNQTGDTDITLPAAGDGTITINQGGSEVATFTVNQVGDTTVDLSEGAIYTAEDGYGISINASNEIRIGDDWSNIPVLV